MKLEEKHTFYNYQFKHTTVRSNRTNFGDTILNSRGSFRDGPRLPGEKKVSGTLSTNKRG